MALSLDEKIDQARVRQFASQIAKVPQNVRVWFEETFSGQQSTEFYEGLLSAYATAYVMAQGLSQQDLTATTGNLVAFVAKELQKRYDEKRSDQE